MEKKIIIVSLILLSLILNSCKDNQTCRDEIFGDHAWYGPFNQYEYLHFRSDDTLEWKTHLADNWSHKSIYDFDDDCQGFVWNMGAPGYAEYKIKIEMIHPDTIRLVFEGSGGFIIHR